MSDNKHIPGQPAVPPEENILKYLKKDMADDQQHEFERAASEDQFMNDALEGLESFDPKKTDLYHLAHQLNADFKKQLDKKNKRKLKRKYKEQPWIYFAVILVVLLIIAAFIVMRQFD